MNNKPFFREFLVNTPVKPSKIVAEGYKLGFLPGIDTSEIEGYKKGLLVAVTEKRTKEEMDEFVNFLKSIK
jgi:glycine dehydrogenase subunit 1